MARIPTVKLVHKHTGKKKIVNQTDYARDLAKWSDWKILTTRRGDATDAQVEEAARESDLNKERLTGEGEHKFRGDKKNAQEGRKIDTAVTTGPAGDDTKDTEPSAPAKVEELPVAPAADPSTMKWHELRKHVHEQTGTWPTSKKHAEELLSE